MGAVSAQLGVLRARQTVNAPPPGATSSMSPTIPSDIGCPSLQRQQSVQQANQRLLALVPEVAAQERGEAHVWPSLMERGLPSGFGKLQ